MNLDAGRFDTAEKWYRAAMKMKDDDIMVAAGLAEATLQKGDAKAPRKRSRKWKRSIPTIRICRGFARS